MKVLYTASEVYPFAKTGGLADVVTALTNELCHLGHDVKLLLPGYPRIKKEFKQYADIKLDGSIGKISQYSLLLGKLPSLLADVIIVDAPRIYETSEALYDGNKLQLFLKFLQLSHAAAAVCSGRTDTQWCADILHANDWHSGLSFRFLDNFGNDEVARVFSIHNLAFTGRFPISFWQLLEDEPPELSGSMFLKDNDFSFLEEALLCADKISTVSPNYAEEILTDQFGFGFQELLKNRRRDLFGILNGVDYNVWHPEQDIHLPTKNACFGPEEKRETKALVQQRCGFPTDDTAILCSFTNRLTHQKMIDILIEAIKSNDLSNFQFIFHGNGEKQYETALTSLSSLPNVKFIPGFKEENEHLFLAGADICLSPSRFEPCGLNALYAMRYGALPLVRDVGGYHDTITDEFGASQKETGCGFHIAAENATAVISSLKRIKSIYKNQNYWNRLVDNAKSKNFSWGESARNYLSLYNLAVRKRTMLRELTPKNLSGLELERYRAAG